MAARSAQKHSVRHRVLEQRAPESVQSLLADCYMQSAVEAGATRREAANQIRRSHGRALLSAFGFDGKQWAVSLGSLQTAYNYLKNVRDDRKHKKFHETVGWAVAGKSGTLDQLVEVALAAILFDVNTSDAGEISKLRDEVRGHVLVLIKSAPGHQGADESVEALGAKIVQMPQMVDYSVFSSTIEKCRTALEVFRVALTKKIQHGDTDAIGRHIVMVQESDVPVLKLATWDLTQLSAALVEQGRTEELLSLIETLRSKVAAGRVAMPSGPSCVSVEIVTAVVSGREGVSL